MKILISFLVLAIAVCTLTAPAFCDYSIPWYSIDGGGAKSTGGQYSLTGTIGQPDTGQSSGDNYVLSSGFRPGTFGCTVNLTDLMILAQQWLAEGEGYTADLDDNKYVDFADFAAFSAWWYDTCPSDWPLK